MSVKGDENKRRHRRERNGNIKRTTETYFHLNDSYVIDTSARRRHINMFSFGSPVFER
jgi:hypothetical protein